MVDNPDFRPSRSAAVLKRLLDMAGASLGLCLLLPLMVVLALVVLITEGFPVFYREQRLGRHGRVFHLYKFRSLRSGSANERSVAPEDDPRISGAGLWLRRWRLDEFPQLINVLSGQMSLVGPRPMSPTHAAALPQAQLQIILSVRPGITDDAAIYFLAEDAVLAGHDDAEALYLERLLPTKASMQIDSLEHWSLVGDLHTLARSLARLWSPQVRARSAEAMHALLNNDRR